MAPAFLVAETVVREEGAGQEIPLGASQGRPLTLTLGITRIIEQESLDISVWGSPDGSTWGTKPLASFPQKFYCGTYHLDLDLSAHPEVTHLRAQWKVNRWGRGDSQPLFGFYLFAQEAAVRVAAARPA